MKKWLPLLPFLFLPFIGHAQVVGPGFVDYVTSAPSGSCSQNAHQRNVMGVGTVYTCQNGTWAQISGGGGGCAQGTCVVNAPTSDQTITGAHALILSDAGSSLSLQGTSLTSAVIDVEGAGTFGPDADLSDSSGVHLWDWADLNLTVNQDKPWTINSFRTEFNPTLNLVTAGTYLTSGLFSSDSTAASTHDILQLVGSWHEALHFGTGAIPGDGGAIGLSGIVAFSGNENSGHVGFQSGVWSWAENDGTGVVDNLYGMYTYAGNFGGSTTNAIGIRIDDGGSNTNSITNYMGILINDQTNGSITGVAEGLQVGVTGTFATGAAHTYGVRILGIGAAGTADSSALRIDDQTPGGANASAIVVLGGKNNLGPQATTVGSLKIPGSSTGTATIVAPAAAGTPTLTLPTATGTFALLGASGQYTLDEIGSPVANTSFTAPATNTYTFLGTAPNSGAGAGTAAGTTFTFTSPAGGATTGSATTGGAGGDFVLTTGAGGSGAGGTNANGGRGGNFTLNLGAGGAKQGSGVVGASGLFTIAGGQTLYPDGTNSLPSVASSSHPGSGMWFNRSSADLITFTESAVAQLELNGSFGPVTRSILSYCWASGDITATTVDTCVNRQSAGVVGIGTNRTNTSGSIKALNYLTDTNCSNAASPAVCGSSSAGVVAVPTGTNPTLTINTTAVTANSRIFLQIDESATIAATTCNTTLSTLVQPVVTARVAATSFTIQIGAVIATNPACVSYLVFN